MPASRLELAVRDGPPLERPEAPDAIVRLPEDELSEQAHRDEQQRRADERDQQLRPNLDRQAGDGADERIVDPLAAPRATTRGSSAPSAKVSDFQDRSFRRPSS